MIIIQNKYNIIKRKGNSYYEFVREKKRDFGNDAVNLL